MHTPDKALEALAAPAPLSLGQVALLDLHKCPILEGDYSDLSATMYALWLLSMPLEQAVAEAHFPEKAVAWAEEIGAAEYQTRLVATLRSIGAFFDMLPKAESGDDEGVAGLKKKSAAQGTETSRKSWSSSAARMAGRFATFCRRFLPCRWRSSTVAGSKGRAV